jgi:RNA polymerase sigma-70 factor (ECF subfamily)
MHGLDLIAPTQSSACPGSVVDLTMEAPREHEQDRDLLRRIGRNDAEAYRALFARYAPTAMALAHRVVRQRTLAEESVQETFLQIWRDPDRYHDDRGSVRAWIMTMVHNRAVDALRREVSQRRRTEQAMADEQLVDDPAPDIVDAIDLPGKQAAVRAALGSLPPEQLEVLELMYFGGLSQSQVAAKLSIPLGTVKSRTLLAMRKLKVQLEEHR